MRRKLIAGNWKMNGSLAANAVLMNEIKCAPIYPLCDIAVCVPAPYFAQCEEVLSGTGIVWGGQDLSVQESGAYTGEVSAAMLLDFGCQYVIVGHSERRAYHAESNELVAQKALRALKSELIPIICVGETLADRESGRTDLVVGQQVDAVLAIIDGGNLLKVVIAYEPIWAIGTGKTATPRMAQEVHAMLRAKLAEKNSAAAAKIQILYGGSMKPDNAKELLAMPDIDGGLIGGAALKAPDFLAIIRAV